MIEHTNLQCKTHNKVLHNACHLSFFQQYPFPIKNLHKIFSIRSCNERVLEPNSWDTTWRNIWAYVINKTETKKHCFIFHEFSCLCTGVMFSLCIVRFFYKWINNKNKSLLHTSHCVWIFIIEHCYPKAVKSSNSNLKYGDKGVKWTQYANISGYAFIS